LLRRVALVRNPPAIVVASGGTSRSPDLLRRAPRSRSPRAHCAAPDHSDPETYADPYRKSIRASGRDKSRTTRSDPRRPTGSSVPVVSELQRIHGADVIRRGIWFLDGQFPFAYAGVRSARPCTSDSRREECRAKASPSAPPAALVEVVDGPLPASDGPGVVQRVFWSYVIRQSRSTAFPIAARSYAPRQSV